MTNCFSLPLTLGAYLAGVLLLLAGLLPSTQAQDVGGDNDMVIQYIDMPLSEVIRDFELYSGKRVIRDAAIMASTVNIETSTPMPITEGLVFVEKSLLLNGFALVPAGKNTLKLIGWAGGKQPRSEGVPIFSRAEDLPTDDEVVSYIMPLNNVEPSKAIEAFSTIVPNHAYGSITPLENAAALVITENASVIRTLIALKEHIDVEPLTVINKTFVLERSDAEEVAEALKEILEPASEGSGPGARNSINVAANGLPGQQGIPGVTSSGPGSIKIDPRIVAIARTNSILAIALPSDMSYIQALIEKLDAPAELGKFLSRELHYLPVRDFLPVARDALLRGAENDGGDIQGLDGQSQSSSRNNNSSNQGGLFGGSGSSGGLGGSGGGSSRGATLGEPDEVGRPISVVVGKTLLIGDGRSNELFVSGPPEDLRIIDELITHIDKRPKQVLISCIIGQLTLTDDFNLGIDYLRTLSLQGSAGGQPIGLAGILGSRAGDRIDPTDLDVISAFPGTQGLSVYGQIGNYFTAILDTLEQTNRFKVLSRPSQFTLNNEKATIVTGRQIAVPLSSFSGGLNNGVTSNIQFREVALRVEVIPLINSDDEITLEISLTNDDIVGSTNVSGNDIPTIGTQQLTTKVIVPNKHTVLLGGLVSQDGRETQSGFPGLVHIPILKHLFGSTGRSVDREELLIFIQPHIVSDSRDMGDIHNEAMRRNTFGEEVMEFANPDGTKRVNPTVWPRPTKVGPARPKQRKTHVPYNR